MNVLAVDCFGSLLSVCLARIMPCASANSIKHPYKDSIGHKPDIKSVSVALDAGFRHVESIMQAIDYCLQESGLLRADIDLLACTDGPGSFTGLRIGLATIKGLALGLGKPFVKVPSLHALAADWFGTASTIVPVIDAKRSHFYFSVYSGYKLVAGPFDADLSQLIACIDGYHDVLIVGPDADMLEPLLVDRACYKIPDTHRRSAVTTVAKSAAKIFAENGEASHDCGLNYLRKSDAEEAALAMQGIL